MTAWLFLGDVWDPTRLIFHHKHQFCLWMLWVMFKAEKTMFRPPVDDSQAARMPRIKRVFTGDYLLDAEMGEVSLGIVFALDHGPAGAGP